MTISIRARRTVALVLATAVAAIAGLRALGSGHSFTALEAGYLQELYGTSDLGVDPFDPAAARTVLGGIAFAPDGDVWSSECRFGFDGTRLHRFDKQMDSSGSPINGTSTVHPETTVDTSGGCGLVNHPDGVHMYSNSALGVVQLSASTGAATATYPQSAANPGNALGIAVDPRPGHHVMYVGAACHPSLPFFLGLPDDAPCKIYDLDPATGTVTDFATVASTFIDGIYFDPTGTYLFVANRAPIALTILRRPEDSVPNTAFPQLVQDVPMTSEPDGVAFHAATPKFVLTNNEADGTMTRFDFAGDDYTVPPAITTFASGGFRGDLLQVGPEGCVYATQGRNFLASDFGTRYDNGTQSSEDSIVRICAETGGGFVPPPGVTETAGEPPPPPPTPGVALVKKTNGTDNPSPTGPILAVGSTVTWTYIVTNTGTEPLTNIVVVDDNGTPGILPADTVDDFMVACPKSSLVVGESMTCTATGTATSGQYENKARASGVGQTSLGYVEATDVDHYFGKAPSIRLIKKTNGTDNDTPTGPFVPVASTVTWTYIVKNDGNEPLQNVVVTDDNGTVSTADDFNSILPAGTPRISCPHTSLAINESMTCTATGTAQAGQYHNYGTASGVAIVSGDTVTDKNIDHYFGGDQPLTAGKTFEIGPSSMEGAIKISAGDWVNGGYSFKFVSGHAATTFTVDGTVTITGSCLTATGQKLNTTDSIVIPLGQLTAPPLWVTLHGPLSQRLDYAIPASTKATDWLVTGDANNVWSWQGAVQAPATLCGGGGNKLDASKGAVFTATVLQTPQTNSLVDFRFKFRDPAAKGKPNTNCLDTSDPNRSKADVCGASWSGTKRDP
jgi:uncharacterized repeat protein (TIGR01451 family)